ncbi:MAG TPA: glycine zipper domain-containing protein [Desulfopila sp.]|nr:glycine zipper domain-containing protein [Desulfopila sp.]
MRSMIFVAALLSLLLTSCANVDLNKGKQGALGGAAGGALLGQAIGRDTEATLIGAAVGTMLGYIVGNEMDKFDKRELNQAYEFTPSGQTTSWQNPDSGNLYQVTPQPAYSSPSSPQRPCRQAEIEAVIDGRRETTYTTACRNDAGQWVLRN